MEKRGPCAMTTEPGRMDFLQAGRLSGIFRRVSTLKSITRTTGPLSDYPRDMTYLISCGSWPDIIEHFYKSFRSTPVAINIPKIYVYPEYGGSPSSDVVVAIQEPYIATVFSQSLNSQTAVVVSEYRAVLSVLSQYQLE
jgi:hypothetical protein